MLLFLPPRCFVFRQVLSSTLIVVSKYWTRSFFWVSSFIFVSAWLVETWHIRSSSIVDRLSLFLLSRSFSNWSFNFFILRGNISKECKFTFKEGYTVVGKCENVILIPIRHETYVNMLDFGNKSKSYSYFLFLIRALGDIYIFV